MASLYLLRNVLFGMGAGDDPKYFAARSDADCGKLTLLWTCLMSLRWPMMMGLAVLGLIGDSTSCFPISRLRDRRPRRCAHIYPDGDWATITAEIAHAPEIAAART